MLQNEGLDEKKTICDMCIKFYIPEGGGGGEARGWDVLAVSPSVTFLKYILGQQISTTISDSRKALLVLLCKLECFAVCSGLRIKLCLAIIHKRKGGKGGENFGNISSISQTHLFHKFYIHISLSTHTSGSIAKPVAFYWFVTIV